MNTQKNASGTMSQALLRLPTMAVSDGCFTVLQGERARVFGRHFQRCRGKVCESVGHSHHIPVTPEIELIHLSDVPIFEPA